MVKVQIVFYSAHGHIYRMAEAIAEGALEVEGAEVQLYKVPETLPPEILEQLGIAQAQKAWENIPLCTVSDLATADAIIVGTPTRFGNMCSQMRAFWDATGPLWAQGALVGKVGSVFTSASNQHGGLEATIITTHFTMLHHGMVIVGLPYSFDGQLGVDEIKGCSPYGASTISGVKNERLPSDLELDGARFQGKFVSQIAKKLSE